MFLCHHKCFHSAIYLDDIFILVHSKWADKRAHSLLCSLLVCLDYILIFPSLTFASLRLYFGGLCWDTVHMSASLPPDKLADIQQLSLSLLQTQCGIVCQVMSFLGKANFCASGYSLMWRLCHVINSVMLTVYHSPPQLFFLTTFPFQLYTNWNSYPVWNRVQFLCNFHFLMWLLLQMPHALIGPFIFRALVCSY